MKIRDSISTNDTFSLVGAVPEDIPVIQRLSRRIWPMAFKNILSGDQLEYMLDWMYSTAALEKQMEDGYHFLLLKSTEPKGYCSFQLEGNKTWLHKIYLLPELWGKGIGKKFIWEIKQRSLKKGIPSIYLNVNRYNKAVQFYQKLGFEIVEEVDKPIGKGYFMNDYIMRLDLERKK